MNPVVLETLANFDFNLYEPIMGRSLDLGTPAQPKAGNLVKVVTGMRRSGKSYRLFQEMKRLADEGVSWNRLCYFNFEDDRLAPVTPQTGDEVLEAFRSLNPDAFDEGVYLFFDEIQEMEDWGPWLRRVVDTTKATIYVTGSSSRLLSREIATGFRGRAIDFELLPLSFSEYLDFNGLLPFKEQQGAFTTSQRILCQDAFGTYLRAGGFPAVQGLAAQESNPILQSYVQQVVARDVIERHDIGRPRVASQFAQRLMDMNGRQLSLRKVANDFKSAGLSTSRELLGDLLTYMQEAYLAFTVREQAYSLKESSNTTAKVYAVDAGLALANARANTNDAGQRLEDAVYLELRRRCPGMRKEAISSLRTDAHGYEVDFIVGDALEEQPSALVQACYDVEDEATLARELRALWEAMEEKHVDNSHLISVTGKEQDFEQDGRTVHLVPAWKWFLQRG